MKLTHAITAIALAVAGTPGWALEQSIIDAAHAEGEVNWYSGLLLDRGVRPIVEAFEAKYPGITVNAVRHQNTETLMLVQTEARAGRVVGDVTDGSDAILILAEQGLTDPYLAESAQNFSSENKDPEGKWTSLVQYFLVPAYNTEMVSEADAPRSYADLLDPKWKGRITWPDAETLTTAAGFLFAAEQALGEEEGEAYLAKLAEQNIAGIPANQRVTLDGVISGEYWIGLMTFNHHSVLSAADGAPVAWIPEFGGVQNNSRIAIIKDSTHPNAARLLVEFILSPDGQTILRDAGYIPTSPDVEASDPLLKPEKGRFEPITITGQNMRDDLPVFAEKYRALFK